MTRGHNITEEGRLISGHNIMWGGRNIVTGDHNITGCSEGRRIITFVTFGVPYTLLLP